MAEKVDTANASSEGLSTNHLYYSDTYLFSCSGKLLNQSEREQNGETLTVIVLDQTVMHPQGGGQPADTGVIVSTGTSTTRFQVSHVQKPHGTQYIEHIGRYVSEGRFAEGEAVTVEIDQARRRLNARIHSAGHLLDSALIRLGMTDLVPSKGYHFPDGPYVEYIGNIPAEKRGEVITLINSESEKLIQEGIPVSVTFNKKGEREVNVGGTGCMCGGTHVKNTSEILGLTVTKIKKAKQSVRVSYTIADSE